MTDSYRAFLKSKAIDTTPSGFDVGTLNPQLFDFQTDIVRWALRRGKAAIFADCGLGKTPMQLEWAHRVSEYTSMPVLILAPLAVAQQTQREGKKFGHAVTICREQSDVHAGINITNYEMLDHFEPSAFGGIVIDESSILKAFNGLYRRQMTEFAEGIGFRLACTATPAPNDLIEITNHSEFLGIMSGKEIIALYFVQDGNTTHKWRLKGHAQQPFWEWMAQWSVAVRSPSDLGFSDDRFILPPLKTHHVEVTSAECSGRLFPVAAATLQERQAARRDSIADRVAATAALVNDTPGPWIVWCNLNAEAEALRKAIPGSVEVGGSDAREVKEAAAIGFITGEHRVLISKPSIFGFGLNLQHCANIAFVGLSDSWEQYYQAVRRCWRFGQSQTVNVYIVTADTEGNVVANIARKEAQAADMFAEIVGHMKGLQLDQQGRHEMEYTEDTVTTPEYTLLLGDSILRLAEVPDESVGLSVFSPPFPGMYAYSNSTQDVGNCDHIDQMIEHFSHLMPDLFRVLKPGRLVCVHLMQLTAMKNRDGYIGVKDYRGRVIQMFEQAGFPYSGEVTIDKNPQIQAVRNKERGLLFKSLATDASVMRMALADYLIYFRKPGENPDPIRAGMSPKYNADAGWITEREWIEWAAPVWYRQTKDYPGGIRETDVLNVRSARESDDERHLCPLQLGVIERAVKLWSNPGDVVLSPFAGIGSEGYVSLKLRRRFLGIELKPSYFTTAHKNLDCAIRDREQGALFGAAGGASDAG